MGETLSLMGEFAGKTHRILECTQTHTPGNKHQKGPTCFGETDVTESHPRAKQETLFPLGLLPHIQCHNAATSVAQSWYIPKGLPLTMEQVC